MANTTIPEIIFIAIGEELAIMLLNLHAKCISAIYLSDANGFMPTDGNITETESYFLVFHPEDM